LKDNYLQQRLINSLSQNCVLHLTHFTLFLKKKTNKKTCQYKVFDLLITDEFCYILGQAFLSEQVVVQMSVTLPGTWGYIPISSLSKAK